MSILLKSLLHPYLAPAGGDGADTGGGTEVLDRGDDFTPTDDDAPAEDEPKKAEPKADLPADEDDIDPDNPDAGEGDEPAADDKPKKKDSRIPLARHKEILEREREQRQALEEKLKQFEQSKQVAALSEDLTKAEDSLIALEAQYNKALAEGEIDKATTLMRQIRTQERAIVEAKAEHKLQVTTAQVTEQIRYDAVLERVEEAYPALNPDHDDFDKAVLAEVVEWKVFNETQKRMTPAKALQAAVKRVLGQETRTQERATETAPRVDKDEAEALAAKKVAADRKKAAVGKALETQAKTPPNAAKVGLDSDKAGGSLTAESVMKMSQEDFMKLPDDVLSRMRGDTL